PTYESDIEQAGPNVTVHVAGPEASHSEFTELVAECCDRMRYENASNFVFDLEKVEFLASACIGALVELLREVEPMRGKIALAQVDENVAFLFKVTKLDDIFGLFDDIDEALESFKKQDARF
ncbi:MAG: STAS domain-containing protein, partial [Planctomycetota bacterium]